MGNSTEDRFGWQTGYDVPPNGDGKAKQFKWQWVYDFMKGDYEVAYHIDEVLAVGQPCMIAGATKTLKTSIGLDLYVSLASGKPFLGRFPVLQGARVGIMSGESGEATIKETLARIARARGI